MTIFKVEEQDCGNLTLKLKNNCGEASAEMKLIIMRKYFYNQIKINYAVKNSNFIIFIE